MKCYYEVLDVARDADAAEIKSAYRRCALKWHPDKNLTNTEHAKEQFQLVQQAYETLSDLQERAWYDKHREQILHGSNSQFVDNCVDIFQYFNTACFKGYGDDDNGFYTVYRNVFDQIIKEDLEFIDDKDEFCSIPQFGDSKSDYDRIVHPFYSYWMSYCTKRSFVWLDPYDIKETRERKLLKLMEKENKKVRDNAKKERNEEVRNLVAFVRKRDKRVQEHIRLLDARRFENRRKHQELSRQKKLERRQELEKSGGEADWCKFDNVRSGLEEIEKSLAAEFGDHSTNSDCSDDENINNLYCVACNKIFKTPKAFENHESSKKHRENVAKLKEEMMDDQELVLSEQSSVDGDTTDSDEQLIEENKQNDIELDELDDISGTDSDLVEAKKPKKNKKQKNVIKEHHNVEDDSAEDQQLTEENKQKENTTAQNYTGELDDLDDISGTDSDVDLVEEKKPKKKNKKQKNVIKVHHNVEDDVKLQISDDDFDFGAEKRQRRKAKKANKAKTEKNVAESAPVLVTDIKINKNKKKQQNAATDDDIDISHCCVTCKSMFPSKNKLFGHLKSTGHGVYLHTKNGKNKKLNKEK